MNTVELGILAFTLLMLLGCLGLMLKLHLSWRKIYQRETERNQVLDNYRNELQMLNSSHLGVGRRVERLGKELNWLREQFDLIGQDRSVAIPYEQMARLAEQGSDARELANLFGIPEAEADLVVKLHAERDQSTTSRPHRSSPRSH